VITAGGSIRVFGGLVQAPLRRDVRRLRADTDYICQRFNLAV
jgi:hypothetical protein